MTATATRVARLRCADALYAQRDGPSGLVWWAGVGDGPECHDRGPAAFASRFGGHGRRVRLLGDRCNVALIVALIESGAAVELASPRFAAPDPGDAFDPRGPIDTRKPLDRLWCAQQATGAASVGGWHRCRPGVESVAYAAAAAIDAGRDPVPQLRRHPASRSWAFAGPLDDASLAAVVASIRDPRWFFDQDHPGRTSALRSYLGLCAPGTRSARARYALVERCWRGRGGLFDREFSRLADGQCRDPDARRTSRRFVEFLRGTWLDAVTDGTRPACETAGWVPSRFFDDVDCAAFTHHLSRGVA